MRGQAHTYSMLPKAAKIQVLEHTSTGGMFADDSDILQSLEVPKLLNNFRLDDTGYGQQGDESTDFSSNEPTSSNYDFRSPQSSAASSVPPRAEEWGRTLRHTGLRDFGKTLQDAAKAVFPNDRKSRYSRVYVLLISWQTEDPKLPVWKEVNTLREVLQDIYNYDVEEFRIPDSGSHAAVSKKINAFVEVNGDSRSDLKIVYYAGHSSLSRNKELVWSNLPDNKTAKTPKVVWSGIQRSCEMAQSDVLILLDCCSSGVANDTEGNGITELICACPFDGRANGVGHYSFTQALITELRFLSKTPCFSVGKLYTAIYTRMQSYLLQGSINERYPPPVHFVLSQNESLIGGIQLSALDTKSFAVNGEKNLETGANRKRAHEGSSSPIASKRINPGELSQSEPIHDTPDDSYQSEKEGLLGQDATPSNQEVSVSSIDKIHSLDGPRALFAIRFREDIKAQDLSVELFLDWLRSIPAAAEEVRVEASFECFSTLLLVTLPLSMASYMPQHPAIFPLGAVKSSIILPLDGKDLSLVREGNGLLSPRERADGPRIWRPFSEGKTGVLQEVNSDRKSGREGAIQDLHGEFRDAVHGELPIDGSQRDGVQAAEVPEIPKSAGRSHTTISSLSDTRHTSRNTLFDHDVEYTFKFKPTALFRDTPLTTHPLLMKTSTTQQQQIPSPGTTPPTSIDRLSRDFNAYEFYLRMAKLETRGDLGAMAQNWSEEEYERRRRLVDFKRTESEATIRATFQAVSQDDRLAQSICISCIYWEEKQEFFVTSVDIMYLLEELVAMRLTVQEKNRIRRNLEGFSPITVSKSGYFEEFHKIIMSFPVPKPRNIEKDLKVFLWKDLGSALKKIIGKYFAISSSMLPPSPRDISPISSTGSIRSYSIKPYGMNHGSKAASEPPDDQLDGTQNC